MKRYQTTLGINQGSKFIKSQIDKDLAFLNGKIDKKIYIV